MALLPESAALGIALLAESAALGIAHLPESAALARKPTKAWISKPLARRADRRWIVALLT
jgi:hypothetical protein